YSFMIHLQGEWGSGKSTFLKLIEVNLNTASRKWIVIDYNAWQNQHIEPPWWSFVDRIYRQAITKLDPFKSLRLYLSESWRRTIWYSGWHKIIAFLMTLAFGLYVAFNYENIILIFEDLAKKGDTFKLGDFSALILSIGSIIGLVYSLSKFLSTPLFLNTSEGARSFMVRATDPLNRISKHFQRLISSINKLDRDVAIFIDDIDRCDREFVIKLLEGIQTLFKEKNRVLYIVAGDKNWISTCFEKHYEDFVDKVNQDNEHLGELFIEKAFQLSFRMPNVSEPTKKDYWDYILGQKKISTVEKKPKISEEERTVLKQRILEFYNVDHDQKDPKVLKDLEVEYGSSEQEISDIAMEALDESQTDVKHLFEGLHELINSNPRAIKRLANKYTINRNIILFAERKAFSPTKLFRWLVIEDLYPGISDVVLDVKKMDELKHKIDSLTLLEEAREKLKILLFDPSNTYGGSISLEEIMDFQGL
ncbi:MAG: KAP family NTPase, partial [Bacteroidia bacterium]|nr:KAP family NTPase [Bacteroidia bacterium]